jgi:hypothetical protein
MPDEAQAVRRSPASIAIAGRRTDFPADSTVERRASKALRHDGQA